MSTIATYTLIYGSTERLISTLVQHSSERKEKKICVASFDPRTFPFIISTSYGKRRRRGAHLTGSPSEPTGTAQSRTTPALRGLSAVETGINKCHITAPASRQLSSVKTGINERHITAPVSRRLDAIKNRRNKQNTTGCTTSFAGIPGSNSGGTIGNRDSQGRRCSNRQ